MIWDGADRWSFDNEDEFLAQYRRGMRMALFEYTRSQPDPPYDTMKLHVQVQGPEAAVTVGAPERSVIERVLAVFEQREEESRVPEPEPEPPPPPPVVFIGHGRSTQWRDLKDHLHDHHGYDVEAYEVGARAGHAVRDG